MGTLGGHPNYVPPVRSGNLRAVAVGDHSFDVRARYRDCRSCACSLVRLVSRTFLPAALGVLGLSRGLRPDSRGTHISINQAHCLYSGTWGYGLPHM